MRKTNNSNDAPYKNNEQANRVDAEGSAAPSEQLHGQITADGSDSRFEEDIDAQTLRRLLEQ